jgi:hypothetical protein
MFQTGPAKEAAKFFDDHLRYNHSLDDLESIRSQLPRDTAVLSALWALCATAARVAVTAGRHTDARRFSLLTQGLSKLVSCDCDILQARSEMPPVKPRSVDSSE